MSLTVGNVIRVRSLRAIRRGDDGKMRMELSYKAPKAEDFVVLVLGMATFKEIFDADKALSDFGWTFDAHPPEQPAPETPEVPV